MAVLLKQEATRGFNCCSCSERIRTCEKYLQVKEKGRNVKGERYCLDCERYARMNNDISEAEDESLADALDDAWAAEAHLRSMEDYAAYQYNGCTQEYFRDRDAGFAN